MLSIQKSRSSQLEQVCSTQLPESGKLSKIAKLYADAFADAPWDEYKVCPDGDYVGRKFAELTNCPKCNQPLKLAYPEDDTVKYITKELSMPESTLITFEEENGNVFAAGWGYACTLEELQGKYNTPEMKEMVVDRIRKTAEKVERVFYLSEVMVDAAVRNRGIATKITSYFLDKSQSLNLNLVMRTRGDSPMVQIANNGGMTQIISAVEEKDNPRVLFIKM